MSEVNSDETPVVQRPQRWWKARPETWILLAGLGCTIWGKGLALNQLNLPHEAGQLVRVALPDAVFFAGALLVLQCFHLVKPSRWAGRAALLSAAVLFVWSLLNTAWLVESGVQIQMGMLKVFVLDARQLWPLVTPHIRTHQLHVIFLGAMALAGGVLLVWFLVRPGELVRRRRHHAWRAGVTAAGVAALAAASHLAPPWRGDSSEAAKLGFSSHKYALVSVITGTFQRHHRHVPERRIPSAGDRMVRRRDPAPTPPPNVVMIILESVSRAGSGLDEPDRDTMGHLARIAADGVDFRLTRAPVSHTTKALWAILTGSDPVIQDNYVEAVLADRPYESLPTILARHGYRSAYFQMAAGSFECASGLTSNLGFDWAWFRENLQDPSARLGWLSGDDFRMIDPAFEWVDGRRGPFLLLLFTSASHDPFVVPDWYGNIRGTQYEKYLHSLRFTDEFIAKVDKALADRGMADNTILCVVGDHGTSFRPSAGRGGGRTWPYEEVIHVPWVIRWPNGLVAGRKIDTPCSQLDITPTLLSMMGMDVSEAGFEGIDALNAPEGAPPRRLYFSSWYERYPIGFVEGDRKIVYWPYTETAYEYDLGGDPGELRGREVPLDQVDSIAREMLDWQQHTRLTFPPKRFRQRLLYGHWQTLCTGQEAWAYYVP